MSCDLESVRTMWLFFGAKEEIVPFIRLIPEGHTQNIRSGLLRFDLNHTIGQIPRTNVVKGALKSSR